jgi:hypothetical protein
MNLFYKISIDHVNDNYISGWCFNRLDTVKIVELQCFCGSNLLATIRADRYREDLKSLGMHRTGCCGFEFVIDSPPAASGTVYSIRVKESRTELAVIDVSKNSVHYPRSLFGTLFEEMKKKRKKERLIVFMHIPKTAGTSFNTLAQQLFGSKAVRTHIELLDPQHYGRIVSNHRYISGHLRFGLLNNYFNSEQNDFYTIVREPYAQLHSHLKWLIQTALNPNDTFFKHNNPIIHQLGEDLAEIEPFSSQKLSQLVARMNSIEAAFLDNSQTRYFLSESPLRVTHDDLKHALTNASKFSLIGTTEEYDVFVRRFVQLNALSVPVGDERMNRSKTDDLFDYRDPQIRAILEPLVNCDLKLYESVIG